MLVVEQLQEELQQAIQKRVNLESQLNSLAFCINVMEKEIDQRTLPQ